MTELRSSSDERLALDSFVTAAKDVLCRNVDGEAVLVDLASGACFELDTTGTRIWERIGAGAKLADVVDALLPEYVVERATVEREVRDFVSELATRGLVNVGAKDS